MAISLLKLTTILSLVTTPFLASLSQTTSSTNLYKDDEEYTRDTPRFTRSRFLASTIKKGMDCDPINNNLCNGMSANNGTSLLYCCKKLCCNVLGDKNNCGQCGHKCQLGELCCHGTCINIAYDTSNCGECDNACSPGLKCEYGSCGYA
ncbi:Protein GRIM REAPER [Camellia lanceoleosa]|uniref:Protein GRIM REAPER n=1 Tax=Camellia lanceoleosa TaxID=1840588 RepID=A0ACC0HF81_9ERIC|nr:Protein GRIM REAPER [Camellia lanceoleosa]